MAGAGLDVAVVEVDAAAETLRWARHGAAWAQPLALFDVQAALVAGELAKDPKLAEEIELKRLKESVEGANERRVALQRETDQCVEKLYELCNALEATDGQHNDDSLLHFMLFSS